MTSALDDAIRAFQEYCAGVTDPEDRRWVRLFMQIDEALRTITSAPMVRDDPAAVEILGNFAHCVTMEDLARQVDLLAYHIATKTGATPGANPRTDARASIGNQDGQNAPMIFKL